MKYNRIATWLLLMPFWAACTVQELPAPSEQHIMEPTENFVPGQALLLLSEEGADAFDPTASAELLQNLGVTAMERVFPEAGEFEARHRAAGLHRWYKVQYDPSVARTKAGSNLSTIPGVEDVVFQPRIEQRAIFDDPYLKDQWHYYNDGSRGSIYKKDMDINVVPVWEKYTGGSKDVIVAVIDSGVQLDHEDLSGVVLTAEEGSRNFVKGYSPETLLSVNHGTHVAGTIAAINNNGIGVSGVAGGLDGEGGVRIMSCGIFSDKEGESGDEAAALVWAADHGAIIANNSWGLKFDNEEDAAEYAEYFETHESALKSAIDYFIKNAGTDADGNQVGLMKGGLVVFASGNEGFAHDVPSEYEPVVAVGAFGPDGKMPLFSNYGPWVDLLAPGGSDSETSSREWVMSLAAKNNYAWSSGTSMACPHVSGVAALLVSYFGGPGFTADQLKKALLEGAVPNVIDLQGRQIGGGKLDAASAFAVLDEPLHPTPSDITFDTTYEGDWQFKSHELVDVLVKIGGNGHAKLPVSVSSDCPGVTSSCTAQQALITIDALQAEPGQYTATVKVGTLTKKSYSFTVLPNHAPQQIQDFKNIIVSAATAAVTTLDMSEYFTDPDGEVLNILVEADRNVVSSTLSDNLLSLKPAGYGDTEIVLHATDARGAGVEASFHLLARNTMQDMDIFPNPVIDILTVRPGNDRTVSVELINAVGATVYSNPSVQAGPFSALTIDMSEMPGGIYALLVNGQRFSIVKR